MAVWTLKMNIIDKTDVFEFCKSEILSLTMRIIFPPPLCFVTEIQVDSTQMYRVPVFPLFYLCRSNF